MENIYAILTKKNKEGLGVIQHSMYDPKLL